MSDDIYKKIFSKNLNYYMQKFGKTQTDMISDLNINKSAISTWCNGTRLPRMDKVQMLADYFKIEKSDLLEEKSESPETSGYENAPAYYYDEDAANAAEFLYKNPEYKVLFDASRKVKAEDIDFVKRMIDRMNGDDGSDA